MSNRILIELRDRLGSLLKTDLNYLFKGAAHLSLGQIATSASGFVLTVGLTRILDQVSYGQYAYIFTIAGVASAFTLSGMDTAVAQAVSKGFNRTVITGFQKKIYWSTPVGVVTVATGAYYLVQQNITLGVSLCIIGLFTPIIYATSLYSSYFIGKKEFKKVAVDNAFKNIFQTLCMLITAYFTHSIVWIVLAYFLSNTTISIVRYLRLIRGEAIDKSKSEESSIRLGKHLSAMDALSVISTHIDKLLVFQLLGATSLAVYALALAPIKQIQNLSKMIRTLILPKFGSRSINDLQKMMWRKTFMFSIVSVLIILVYWFTAPFVFTLIFPRYHEAILYSQVLSLSLLAMPFVLYAQALVSQEKTRELYFLNIIKPVVRTSLLLVLIPFYGIWGAIFALFFTLLIMSIAEYLLFMNKKS